MAEVVRVPTLAWLNQKTRIIPWTGLLTLDSGQAVDMANFQDKTIHIFGTWGGATCTLYGSNDPRVKTDRDAGTLFGSKTASWVKCKDNLDNDIAKLADGGDIIIENYLYNCVVVTGGDVTTSLSAIISAVKVF